MRKEAKGAVTIFLNPGSSTDAFSNISFVDASKIFLTNSVVESSADLALESALTYYDQDIKDIYGLFATAQNMDEVYDNCEKYFKNMISMSGLNEDDTDFYLNEIMDLLLNGGKSTDLSNFLQLEIDDVEIKPVENSSLANPTVLEQQIVDFMKYRSPINTGLSFIEGLKSFNTLNSQKKLVDARKAYYEELSEVMKKLINAWKAINEYNSLDISYTNYQLSQEVNRFPENNSIEHYYYECTLKHIFDQGQIDTDMNTILESYFYDFTNSMHESSSGIDYRIWLEINGDDITYFHDGSGHEVKSSRSYNKNNIGTNSSVIDRLVDSIETLSERYLQDYTSNGENTFPSPNQTDHKTQFWLLNSKEYQKRASDAVKIFELYLELQEAVSAAEDYNANIDNEPDEEKPDKEIVDPIDINTGNSDLYYNDIKNDVIKTNDKCRESYEYAKEHISESMNKMGKLLWQTHLKLQNVYDVSKKMIDALKEAEDNLNAAYRSIKNGDLKKAMDTWKDAAESSDIKDTKMAKQDQEEIKDLETAFDYEMLKALVDTVGTVKGKVEEIKKLIDEFTICGKKLREIDGYSSLAKAIRSNVNVDTADNSTIKNKQQSFVASYYKNSDMDLGWLNKDATCLSFTAHVDANSNQIVDCTKEDFNFYKYLLTQFGQLTEENEATTKYSKFKENLNNQAEDVTGGETKKDITSLGSISETELPSQGLSSSITTNTNKTTDVDKFNKTEVVSDENIANDLLNFGAGLMDRLYVSDYIMSMFSYYTIEQEEKTEEGEAIKSLTLEPISKETHKYYPAEVEYIIYGDKDLSSNVNKAKASIYGLRLAFNVIYAFSASEIRDTAFPIAQSISAATAFVVPAPLIQAVIIISIACIESAIDLIRIMNGEKVVLFKTAGTWITSLSGLTGENAKNIALNLKSEAFDEGSKMIGQLLDSSDQEIAKLLEDGTLKDSINDYLVDAINSAVDRFSKEIIQKLNTTTSNVVNKYLQINPVAQKNGKDGTITYDFSKLPVDEIKEEIIEILYEWNKENSGSSELEALCKEISYEIAINYIDSELIYTFASRNENEIYVKLNATRSLLQNEIMTYINLDDKIKNIKNTALESIMNSANEGALTLKNTINYQMKETFSNGKSDDTQESILSFSYKDYLRLFSMFSLYNNNGENASLKRVADLIQVNLTKEDNNLDLTKAFSNISIEYSYKSKPTLLSLSLFDDYDDFIDDIFANKSIKISKGY